MTIKETYTGKASDVELISGLYFLGFGPAIKMDPKHQQIVLSDPSNHENALVLETSGLKVHGGQITAGHIIGLHASIGGKTAVTLAGADIDATSLNDIFSGLGGNIYETLCGNLKGTVVATGDKYKNIIEVGSQGTATVNAGGGDDTIYVWQRKNVVLDGGSGTDALIFDSYEAATYPPAHSFSVDLEKGTGTNPFGGTIKLKNVENLINIVGGDSDFRGDNHDNYLYGGMHSNTLIGRGGDDQLRIWERTTDAPRETVVDGGKGIDLLYADLTEGAGAPSTGTGETLRFHNRLDLEHASRDTGTFAGGTFKNLEEFQVFGYAPKDVFEFYGAAKGETVTASESDDYLNGRNGNDVLSGAGGADKLIGGNGADHFQYHSLSESAVGTSDTIKDFKHSQHDRIDLSPIFASMNFGGAYVYVGSRHFDGKASEVRFEHDGHGNTLVLVDDNADKHADMEILLVGNFTLVKGDFIL